MKILLLTVFVLLGAAQAQTLSESEARTVLDGLYKGDYREAFVQKRPEPFLRHIPDDFKSVSVEGNVFDAAALRQFFPNRFQTYVRLIEHNVSIEDIDVLPDGTVSAVVTLFTVEEYRRSDGGGNYLVSTLGTYRDTWQKRGEVWFEVKGDQLRNQVITSPRP